MFVGLAVQGGATILPEEGKCKSSDLHTSTFQAITQIRSNKVGVFSPSCSSSQGGAMAGEVACLSSMTEGKVNTGCVHVGSNSNVDYGRRQLSEHLCALSEGVAVQRREPAGQRDALRRAQTQECTEDHAASRVPLSRCV